MLKVENKNVCG